MSEFLNTPLIPQSVFVKLASVDRQTIENWVRAGSLKPAESGVERASESLRDIFGGGTLFSLGDLLKVELMEHARRTLAMPPKAASSFADDIISQRGSDISSEIIRLVSDPHAERDDKMVVPFGMFSAESGGISAQQDKRSAETFMVLVPLGAFSERIAKKYSAYDKWAEIELPKAKTVLAEMRSGNQ